MRLSGNDPDVFYKFKQVFIDKAPYASEKQQHDVALDMESVFMNYYPLQQSKDVPFEVGRVFMGLKRYARAVAFFDLSQRYCGEHHVSWCAARIPLQCRARMCLTQSPQVQHGHLPFLHGGL